MTNVPAHTVNHQQSLEDEIDYQSFVSRSADMNVVKSVEGRYRYVSPASLPLFGWDPSDLQGSLEDKFIHSDDLSAVRSARNDLPVAETDTTRYRFLCRTGAYRWTETSSQIVKSSDCWVVVSTVRDITERQRHETDLQMQVCTDPLTGVSNRTVLMDRIQHGLRRLERNHHGLAVMYLDLDRFKAFNDALGHSVGDQILMTLAGRLAMHLRPSDTIARLGGDEFVVVADDLATMDEAVELADRLAEAIRAGIQVNKDVYECTLSVGVSWTTDPHIGAANLLREADLALYRAKDCGRNRVEVFDEILRLSAASRLTTERMLQCALDENRVVVEYQPIVDLGLAQMVGAEALVRIHDSITKSLVLPESFLTIADEVGLLSSIDDLVLADAVRQAADWIRRFGLTGFGEVAINVTARHLANSRFPITVVELLDSANVPRNRLQVELTERTLIEASNSAVTALRSLRQAGVQVGLDDFGTGYSSLAYLRQFPLDFVKLDRSLIRDLERGSTDRSVVGAIIGLAHALGLQVVAEGVETDVQRRFLEELKCDRAQGFLFAGSGSPEQVSNRVMGPLFPKGQCHEHR